MLEKEERELLEKYLRHLTEDETLTVKEDTEGNGILESQKDIPMNFRFLLNEVELTYKVNCRIEAIVTDSTDSSLRYYTHVTNIKYLYNYCLSDIRKIKKRLYTDIRTSLEQADTKVRYSLLTALRAHYADNFYHLFLSLKALWDIAEKEDTLPKIWLKSIETQQTEGEKPKLSSESKEITKKQESQIRRTLGDFASIYLGVMENEYTSSVITPDSEDITITLELFRQNRIPEPNRTTILNLINVPQTFSEIPSHIQPIVETELSKIFTHSSTPEKNLYFFTVYEEVLPKDKKTNVLNMLRNSRDGYAKLSEMPQEISSLEIQWEILLKDHPAILYLMYTSAQRPASTDIQTLDAKKSAADPGFFSHNTKPDRKSEEPKTSGDTASLRG